MAWGVDDDVKESKLLRFFFPLLIQPEIQPWYRVMAWGVDGDVKETRLGCWNLRDEARYIIANFVLFGGG